MFKPLVTFFPLIPTPPHLPPHTHTLSRPSERQGGTHGYQIALTFTLLQILFPLPGTHFPLTPNPNYQLTPPHPSGLRLSAEAISPGSLSSGVPQYPVHPLYHSSPLTLLVPHSVLSPPQASRGPSTFSCQPALPGHNFTSLSSGGQAQRPPQCHC